MASGCGSYAAQIAAPRQDSHDIVQSLLSIKSTKSGRFLHTLYGLAYPRFKLWRCVAGSGPRESGCERAIKIALADPGRRGLRITRPRAGRFSAPACDNAPGTLPRRAGTEIRVPGCDTTSADGADRADRSGRARRGRHGEAPAGNNE